MRRVNPALHGTLNLKSGIYNEGTAVVDQVLKSVARYGMLAPGARVAAAVSGGADSVCLLHVLREIQTRFALTLAVAHFNHKLRGEESDGDECFVREMAAQLGLPFYRAEMNEDTVSVVLPLPHGHGSETPRLPYGHGWETPVHLALADARGSEGNLEQRLREARRDFFCGLMRDHSFDRIALGHTRDDQAETVLFRLLRGSGLAGLAGIHPVGSLGTFPDGMIRPLIRVTRAEVEDFLRSRGIPWREDASNRDAQFARNRIRHDLLPQLTRDWNPRLGEALAHLADLAQEEEGWWRTEIDRRAEDLIFERGDRAYTSQDSTSQDPASHDPTLYKDTAWVEIHAPRLAALPRTAARRLIRRAITLAKGNLRRIEFDHIERLLDLAVSAAGKGRLALPDLNVTRSFEWIRLARPGADRSVNPRNINVPGVYVAPDASTEIYLDWERPKGPTGCVTVKSELCLQRIPPQVELRGWRPGDRYRPVGKTGNQKVREMFQQARIPSWRRRFWPILTSGGKILWAREFGAAAEYSASEVKGPGDGPRLYIWEIRRESRR